MMRARPPSAAIDVSISVSTWDESCVFCGDLQGSLQTENPCVAGSIPALSTGRKSMREFAFYADPRAPIARGYSSGRQPANTCSRGGCVTRSLPPDERPPETRQGDVQP